MYRKNFSKLACGIVTLFVVFSATQSFGDSNVVADSTQTPLENTTMTIQAKPHHSSSIWHADYTRLLFAPTALPLGKGQAYLSNHYILFQGFAYGLTERLSLMGGMSVIPLVKFKNQLKYLAPKYALVHREKFSMAVGGLYSQGIFDFQGGLVYSVATFGDARSNFTAGLGWGFSSIDGDFSTAEKPLLMLGGVLPVSERCSLVFENYNLIGSEFDIENLPITLAARFGGSLISVDLGAAFTFSMLGQGFPVPWLSFSYKIK
jgi:hypothetical protein